MLDLQFVCENQALVEENCRNRGVRVDVARVVELARQRSQLIVEGDKHRHEQKEIAAQIPKIADKEQRQALVDKGKQLKTLVAENDTALKALESQLRELEMQIPNLTHPDAPVGPGEQANRTVRTWGEKKMFDFKPRDHVELMERLDLVDLEAGTRVAGHGFYFLKNEAVLLELGLVQLALEKLRAAGFTLFTTPDLARDDVLQGIGFLPRGPEAQIYSIENTDLSLVATAEITLGGSRKDQILEAATLPLKYAGLSHCFRTEAGAHGKATRGIYRVHQFTKVEMFGFTKPDVALSDAFLEQVVAIEENLFQTLGIPYRVIDTSTGDLGGPAYRKFDLEAWMPGRDEYGEVTSASNCTDYQARRLGIRCKGGDKKGTQFVHTLNGTAVAATRAIIAILENYQQADGSVIIPESLRKWVGQDRITPRTS
ncbi:MAG TPA: serine--tRNA ligase [Planctomycetaceae bacterium]|jgi:seryl-tRNA synthetase|nr:serine--tRNA ligase [Planctomycetaceae bacterium]